MPSHGDAEGSNRRRQLNWHLLQCHEHLLARYGVSTLGSEQPCLIFGRYYGQSPILYLSLNPPLLEGNKRNELRSENGFNIPFRNSDALKRQYSYLRNCERFLEHHDELRAILENKVTNAFLVPWRTRTLAGLYRLNHRCTGKLFTDSRNFLCTVLRDHEARILLVAGVAGLRLLQDLKVAQNNGLIKLVEEDGSPGTYRWSRSRFLFDDRTITVLQIPHFSRANSLERMKPLGIWLTAQMVNEAGIVLDS